MLYPQTDGRATYFVATSAAAGETFSQDLDEFLVDATRRDDVDADAFQKLVRSGPEVLLAIDKAQSVGEAEKPLEHGIGFRLRLPYRSPTIDAVKLNGRVLDQSDINGWQSWFANGFTQVQVNLPPAIASKSDLFAISCEYTPDVVRRIGWTPPLEVLQQLKP